MATVGQSRISAGSRPAPISPEALEFAREIFELVLNQDKDKKKEKSKEKRAEPEKLKGTSALEGAGGGSGSGGGGNFLSSVLGIFGG